MFPRGRYDRSYYSLDYNVPIGSDGLNLRVGGYQYRGKMPPFITTTTNCKKPMATSALPSRSIIP